MCFHVINSASRFLLALAQGRHVEFCMFDSFHLVAAFNLNLFVVNCVDTPIIRSCSALKVSGSRISDFVVMSFLD